MTATSGYLEAVGEALAGLGAVKMKRMFGGAGIWADGVMFALVVDDALYLKADDATRARFETEGLGPFCYEKKGGQVAVMSYWRAPERLIDDADEMLEWARPALAVAQSAARRQAAKGPDKRRAAKKDARRASAARPAE
ncbi:MAG: TfoX/Sxy family protein [Hyphomicrobiaceae bacterium]